MHLVLKTAKVILIAMGSKNVALTVICSFSNRHNSGVRYKLNPILIHYIHSVYHLGCGNSCMAIVADPGQDLLGGEDVPDAPIDPNAPQIRVSQDKDYKIVFE